MRLNPLALLAILPLAGGHVSSIVWSLAEDRAAADRRWLLAQKVAELLRGEAEKA